MESTVLRRDAGVVSATLHIDDTAYGAPQRLELVRSHALGRSVTSDPEPAVRYAPRVENPVTDGVLPDGDYHDGRWLAWEGPDATVVVDLGAAPPHLLARIRAGGRVAGRIDMAGDRRGPVASGTRRDGARVADLPDHDCGPVQCPVRAIAP